VGKASRRKARGHGINDQAAESDIRGFLARVAPVRATSLDFWTGLEAQFGYQYAARLHQATGARELGSSTEPWELLWANADTALGTFLLSCPWAREWMTYWLSKSPSAGDVLDLGSGSGVLTCFYAIQRPTARVLGVELSERGVETGREVAERLGVSNVAFLQGDVTELDLDERFEVVVGTALRHELGWADPPNTFSTFQAVGSANRSVPTAGELLANTVARHLRDDGIYLSFERCPGDSELLEWMADLEAAELIPDLDSSRYLSFRSLGSAERMPALVVGHGTRLPVTNLARWGAVQGRSALSDEARIFMADAASLLGGFHADVEDQFGPGATRVYLLEVDGEYLLWQTTTRGSRALVAVDQSLAPLNLRLSELRALFEGSGDVVAIRPLDGADLSDIVQDAL
jgi:SAM-dependent methyltransferase